LGGVATVGELEGVTAGELAGDDGRLTGVIGVVSAAPAAAAAELPLEARGAAPDTRIGGEESTRANAAGASETFASANCLNALGSGLGDASSAFNVSRIRSSTTR
jgi:hypothetical protein